MTNLQILQHLIGSNADLTTERLQVALALEDLDPAANYSSADRCKLYKLAILEIQTAKGVKSVSEGDYQIVYSDSSIPGALKALADTSGCADLIAMFAPVGQPKIRNKSSMW